MLQDLITEYANDNLYEKRTPLCDLFKKHGSDKSTWHNYSTLYDFLFKKLNLLESTINLFELGLGTNNINVKSNMGLTGIPGASLYAFSEYLKDTIIYGADVDEGILFQTDRIKTFFCDQTDPKVIEEMWSKIDCEFDVIIDDGLHEAHANITFCKNSFHKLKDGGVFIIEDILNEDLKEVFDFMNTVECKDKILLRLPMDYKWTENDERFRGRVNNFDNNVAILIR